MTVVARRRPRPAAAGSRRDLGDGGRVCDPHPGPVQVGAEHVALQGLVAHRRENGEGGDHAHLVPVGGQQFGDARPDVVAVGVVDHHPPARAAACPRITCSGVSTCGSEASAPGIGSAWPGCTPSPAPRRPGRDHHQLGAVVQHVGRAQPAARDDLHPGSLASWTARQSVIRPQSPSVGSRRIQRSRPPISGSRLDQMDRAEPALGRARPRIPSRPARRRRRAPAGPRPPRA